MEEHKVVLPDGDLIGQPLVYSDKCWLVCLIQPCVKSRFSGMMMEQRVGNIQVIYKAYAAYVDVYEHIIIKLGNQELSPPLQLWVLASRILDQPIVK